ncbi:hypothetical protein F4778DRAFT_769886 [Xylariomycetidae sp. FL2044]|nr:hypothetical protein F4778DRAFT_769886 [Xylariomycetidae sp. FL2044]
MDARTSRLREHIDALKQSGLSRDELLAILEETDSQPQPSHQTPQEQEHQHQHQQQQYQHQQQLSQQAQLQLQLQHQQQQSQSPQQQPQQQQQQPLNQIAEAPPIPNFSYRQVGSPYDPHSHQYRSSISTISSNSSGLSALSTASTRSSVSSTAGHSTEAKYWCTSCNKTFKRKFDWKRHEEEFHERWRKFPCPSCNQSFWGPNTFNQHHKSAHGCKSCPHADSVVKTMRRRKAWGCGICAALQFQFEKHIDHVAGHFESGSTKADWLHSHVIYGLLHQHGIHEPWKAFMSSKQNESILHQPKFSWSPESTGRAQGFVEGENPGQLQDLLEFFDGSTEAAERILQQAESCVQIDWQPRMVTMSHEAPEPHMPSSNAHKHVSILARSREPKRSVSTSSLSSSSRYNRRATSATRTPLAAPHTVPSMGPPPPNSQPVTSVPHAYQQPFLQSVQEHQNPTIYVDKALPPVPLAPSSPMNIDFPIFEEPVPGLLPTPEFTDFGNDDWHSFTSTSTLIEEPHQPSPHPLAMAAQGYPTTWADMNQYNPPSG